MTDKPKINIGIENWIGKIILIIIGTIWMVSSFYPHVMRDFFLTDRKIPEWGNMSDVAEFFAQTGLILGGAYLNKVLDFLTGRKSKDDA